MPLLKLDKMLWWTVGVQKMGLVDPTTGVATLDLCPSHAATAQGGQIPYSCGAVVDTGTSMLGVPYGLWDNFYLQLQAHATAQRCRIPEDSSLQAGGVNVMGTQSCTPAQYPTLRFELPSDVPPASPDEPYSAPPVVFALHPDSYVRESITEWSPGVRRLSRVYFLAYRFVYIHIQLSVYSSSVHACSSSNRRCVCTTLLPRPRHFRHFQVNEKTISVLIQRLGPGAIYSGGKIQFWILGDTLIKSNYTQFDYDNKKVRGGVGSVCGVANGCVNGCV